MNSDSRISFSAQFLICEVAQLSFLLFAFFDFMTAVEKLMSKSHCLNTQIRFRKTNGPALWHPEANKLSQQNWPRF